MLDIKRIREDYEGVKKAVESRGKGDFGIDKVREFDLRRREILATVEQMKNEQKVSSAKWMTTGLGVYELFLNGRIVGEEILKPGFTHVLKTRRSFTYDITDDFNTKAGAENEFCHRQHGHH